MEQVSKTRETEHTRKRNRRNSNDLSGIIRLKSGNPIKRKKVVQFGRPDDYDTNLNADGEQITRGDESRLMDPPISMVDDLYWIRSDDRTDPDVLDLLTQLNRTYADHIERDEFKETQESIFDDMKSRVAGDETNYPQKFFHTRFEDFTRMEEGKGHPIYCRRNIDTCEEMILLDVNEYVKTVEKPDTCDVTNVTTSFDCRYLTYCVDLTGDEKYELNMFNLETGERVEHTLEIPLISGAYLWSPDSIGVFYYGYDRAERVYQVWFHSFVSEVSTLLYQEDDTLFQVDVSLSNSLNYVFIGTESLDTTEHYFCPIAADYTNSASYSLIRERVENIKYYPEAIHRQRVTVLPNGVDIQNYPEIMVIRTNIDDSYNFKVVWANFESPSDWVDMVAHAPTRFIESIDTICNYVLIDYREAGYARAGYVDLSSSIMRTKLTTLKLNENQLRPVPSTVQFSDSHNRDYTSRTVYVSYESFISPSQLFEVRLPMDQIVSPIMNVVWQKTVPNYNSDLYASQILQVPSSDGKELIPVSLLYKKSSFDPRDPVPTPFYLYGYGAYGVNNDTPFISKIFSLIDRGFIFGIAHVRGSSSKGYKWYLDGKMENKQNTFTDYIDCAKYLIKNNYTRPKLLSAEGRSAGGLLMGAILTQAPQLFNSVVMGVPFVDVLVTMSDSTIPLTTDEWIEWGNPNYAENYEIMSAYSPIDNIRQTYYPNTYITCGLTDPRVQYWEPVKFQLRLLENCMDDYAHLIHVDTDKGHFSNTDRYAQLREYSKQYAFVMCNTMNALE
jgi:oligopeptidase B